MWPHGVKRGKEAIAEAGRLYDISANHESGKRVLNDSKKILADFYASDIFSDLKKQKILGSEVPFLYSLSPRGRRGRSVKKGTLAMHGIMDLVYEDSGQVIVADYKTSRVTVDTKECNRRTLQSHRALLIKKPFSKRWDRKALFELIFLRTNEKSPALVME